MDLTNLTDAEVTELVLGQLPRKLQRKFHAYKGPLNNKANAEFTREWRAALPKELVDAVDKRQFKKDLMGVIAEPTPILKLLPQAPLGLRHLRLPPVCSVEILSPMDRLMKGWHNATWSDIEAQRRILTQDCAWSLLDAVKQLSRAVEPFMRDHPARTLAEVLPMLGTDVEPEQGP